MGIDDNLIGLWRLNKGSGLIAYDTSGNGNNGALEGTNPTWIDGKSGKAVNLPGVNERIYCGNGAPLDDLGNGSFWLSFWIKSKDTVPLNAERLFSKGEIGDFLNYFTLCSATTSNRLRFEMRTNGVFSGNYNFSTATTPFDTKWNHIVLVVNRTTDLALLYMNTIKDAVELDISACATDASNDGNVSWGARESGAIPYEGRLDEMRIYTGVPTQAKIDFLYNNPSGVFIPVDFITPVTTQLDLKSPVVTLIDKITPVTTVLNIKTIVGR